MRFWSATNIACIFMLLFWSCSPAQDKEQSPESNVGKAVPAADSSYRSIEITSDTNIVNTSGHRIIALYNSVNDFLEKTDTAGLHFSTECMICEAVIPYEGHLVFANQLKLSADGSVFSRTERFMEDTIKPIKRVGSYASFNPVRFNFSNGTGQIRHLSQSCNDAYLMEVVLKYGQGDLKIRNVLNAEFFEYDLDKDGELEQYILAMRNCSQELAVLRIL